MDWIRRAWPSGIAGALGGSIAAAVIILAVALAGHIRFTEVGAAWVQAIGSIIAVCVAIAVPLLLRQMDLTAARQEAFRLATQAVEAIEMAAERASWDQESLQRFGIDAFPLERLQQARDDLQGFPMLSIHSTAGAVQLAVLGDLVRTTISERDNFQRLIEIGSVVTNFRQLERWARTRLEELDRVLGIRA